MFYFGTPNLISTVCIPSSRGQDSSSSTDVTSSIASSAAALSTPFSNQSSSDGPFSANSAAGHTKFFRQSSNEGIRFNSTSGSLETLTRRGSNPDQLDGSDRVGLDSSIGGSSRLSGSSLVTSPQRAKQQVCACSCTGWAEIFIRRPTGNMSWVMRVQNQITLENAALNGETSLHDIIGLFMPSLGGVFGTDGLLLNNVAGDEIPMVVSPSTSTAAATTATVSLQQEHSTATVQQRSVSVNVSPKPALSDADIAQPRSSAPMRDQPPLQPPKSILKSESSSSTTSTGPIDIPQLVSQETKVSAGSFSDIEPEEEPSAVGLDADADPHRSDGDNVSFDGDESRSRNPVRRVNSSPEMSSSWRNPFLSQKGAPTAADYHLVEGAEPASVTTAASVVASSSSGTAPSPFAEIEQQRKKSAFGNNMRVSCEAIPEEIAGSTPPSLPGSTKDGTGVTTAAAAAATALSRPASIDQVTRAAAFASSSASFPADATVIVAPGDSLAGTAAVPKKQLSADDALAAASSSKPSASVGGETTVMGVIAATVKLKLPMDMPKVTTKPPQSPTPLSPRLLAKNAANQVASLSAAGPSFVGSSGAASSYADGNGGNGNGDLIRVRSKTISVVRGEHENRDSMKWPFRGSTSLT